MPAAKDFVVNVLANGFALVSGVLKPKEIDHFVSVLEHINNLDAKPSVRNLYATRGLLEAAPEIRQLVRLAKIRQLVEPILGKRAFLVRGLLFDKTLGSNWKAPWHQDVAISVQKRVKIRGFKGWSSRAGLVHVQPPPAIQEKMLTIRIHLDSCSASKGPLRVIPGTHTKGHLTDEEIRFYSRTVKSVSCPAGRGDVLLMRPLLVHASSQSSSTKNRRVIHLDFAARALPGGLRWAERRG